MSKDFKMEMPGKEFPPSWTSRFSFSHGHGKAVNTAGESIQPGMLEVRNDCKAQVAMLKPILQTAVPIFDKRTEEGARFRIYKVGCIEVRTVQDYEGEETIAIVFSINTSSQRKIDKIQESLMGHEKLVKVTEFVEKSPEQAPGSPSGTSSCQYYTVVETVTGNVIVAEKLRDGTATLTHNPKDLNFRISLAKTICTKDCGSIATTVSDLIVYHEKELREGNSSCKHYAQGAYSCALGLPGNIGDSFKPPRRAMPLVSLEERLARKKDVQAEKKSRKRVVSTPPPSDEWSDFSDCESTVSTATSSMDACDAKSYLSERRGEKNEASIVQGAYSLLSA